MITEIERKELRQLFQGYYADDVLEILKEKKMGCYITLEPF